MSVGIVGAGNMGKAIGLRMVVAGEPVILSDIVDGLAQSVAGEITSAGSGAAREGTLDELLACDTIVLAMWHDDVMEFAEKHKSALSGKTVVDIQNPVNSTFDALVTPPGTSGAEMLAETLTDSTVLKAFNTAHAPALTSGKANGVIVDVFVAGYDAGAKYALIDRIERGGVRGVDVGALPMARVLEGMGLMSIGLAMRYDTGFASCFKYLMT